MAGDRGGVLTVVGVLALIGVIGGLAYQAQKGRLPPRPHNHADASADRGAGGHGRVVSLGNDEYHVEVVLGAESKLYLFTLGADETRVNAVSADPLLAFVKRAGEAAAVEVTLVPSPQPGDAHGTASRFVAVIPPALGSAPLEVTVPNLTVEGKRFRFSALIGPSGHGPEMPAKVTEDEERRLYLTPGGDYTAADVAANGRRTASDKFKGFRAKHDAHPKAGDRLCPVTNTKASLDCAWVIGGRTYFFCCPPCVDEFVKQAKERPGTIRAPEEYVQR